MKPNKIITATLLSAGLIVGSMSVASATDPSPAPTATVTLSAYQVQLAAYGTSVAAYDSATVTFKAQAIVFGTAVQNYKMAYQSAFQTYGAFLKANTPANNPAAYVRLLAAYKAAMVAYNSATVVFKAQLSTYQSAVKIYKTAYENAVRIYKVTISMRENLRGAINIAFEGAVHSANAVFATAMGIATTADQKLAATTARQNAIANAIAVRKVALDAVGVKPAYPKHLIKLGDRGENYKVDPPAKPEKSDKSDRSDKSKKSKESKKSDKH